MAVTILMLAKECCITIQKKLKQSINCQDQQTELLLCSQCVISFCLLARQGSPRGSIRISQQPTVPAKPNKLYGRGSFVDMVDMVDMVYCITTTVTEQETRSGRLWVVADTMSPSNGSCLDVCLLARDHPKVIYTYCFLSIDLVHIGMD